MASACDVGQGTVRDLTGVCDWCGDECYGNQEICVHVSCHRCDGGIYHQACIEKFLKKFGLPSNRKAGFPCPLGKGKVSTVECKGKIEKSHPIVPKNEEKKKARMAPAMQEAMARPAKAPAAAPKAPAAAKPPAPKPPAMPRKVTPPKAVNFVVARPKPPSSAGPSGVWGQHGAAPVLAGAHLPEPAADSEAAAGAAAGGGEPRPAQVPVGLVLEEALSKAQKKNLARKKKRQAATALETASEGSNEGSADGAAAAGASGPGSDAGSVFGGGAAAVAALVGFDGAAVLPAAGGDDVLAQQGHKFITDVSHFNRLLGLYCDSEDEEECGDDGAGGEQQQGLAAAAGVGCVGGVGFSAPVTPPIVPVAPPGVVPATALPAPPPPAAAPAAAADASKELSEQAALDAAVAASIKQYHLEQEMRAQREVLAHGFGANNAALAAFSKPVPVASSAGYGLQQAPPPVQAPVAAPVAVPTPAPMAAAPDAAPALLYPQTKQQPQAPAAPYGNGWVFGGGNQGTGALPPHIPSAYAAAAPPAGYGAPQYGGVGSIAAGHSAAEVASDDDDGLSSLLALCGVAT